MTSHRAATPSPTSTPGASPAGLSTGWVEAFSDGIIAIAATLLVIELSVPDPGSDVVAHLHHELPALAAYVVSFLTILIFWVNHHALFATVRSVDRGLLFLNGLLLLMISFISYPTAVLGRALQDGGTPARQAAVFYTGVLTVASAAFLGLWVYLDRRRTLLEDDARGVTRPAIRRGITGTACYAAAMVIAVVSGPAALVAVAALAVYFALPPRHRSPSGAAAA